MKKNRLTNLEAFKLTSSSLHYVTGGDYTCHTGAITCSGPNSDQDDKNPSNGSPNDQATSTIGTSIGSSSSLSQML